MNFTFPLGSSLDYAVTTRAGAVTAIVLLSSSTAEMGHGKWLRSSE